ncbi:carotenoid biosynthesis protein [Thermomicrobiaceae bacterium CFH 74404]|uniref:Carotenoid biosynthesis protein n=1 Tax=Thermalbibacter longus TaxID=2951981 RepID=A0AA41WAW8_9BACT|nr:carotenoid biosynthesis protein [Thermalbibacter longus]MCM8748057.1 carotenoid biosynthesis protein [Thermalbibacter longus]
MNRVAWWALAAHLATMAFGLAGLTIAMRRPDLWSHSQVAADVYAFGTRYAGAVQIILAAVAVLAFGIAKLGLRRTAIFFGCATTLSLASELIGTGTGWPFGNYSYTSGLGYKILDRVPFTIPLSWFYMGLASYLIGIELFRALKGRLGVAVRLLAGVWLLVVWDLVLDPAMAHETLSARFWVWHETGPYHGMPLQNFAGWAFTALAFMGLSRLLWRSDPALTGRPLFPVVVYQANLAFAVVLCASVGLWSAIALGLAAGGLPALVPLIGARERRTSRAHRNPRSRRAVDLALRLGAGVVLRGWQISVSNVDRLLPSGPAVLAVRHEHHLYDACALIVASSRPLRFVVALDWVGTRWQRFVMERLCDWARWPVILRPQRFQLPDPPAVYIKEEVQRYLVGGLREALNRLAEGEIVVVFPEGFPVVDPHTPGARDRLGHAFHPGVVWVACQAARRCGVPIPVVPVGLRYDPFGNKKVEVQFGPPIFVNETADQKAALAAIEAEVRALSAPAPEPAYTYGTYSGEGGR